jgi:hypothetical protein
MSYRDFKFKDLEDKFGVKQKRKRLFSPTLPNAEPSDLLQRILERVDGKLFTTEKALSENIVSPILQEIWFRNKDKIELFSGENLEAEKSKGLNGECDFIIARAPHAIELTAPIINICEAKKGEVDNARSLSQTAAQLIGAKIFNQKNNFPTDFLYGVCTSGREWLFLKLENDTIYIDTHRYFQTDLPELLGVLQSIVDEY